MTVALFFFSCEEETTFLGFPADQRFNVYYTEVPVLSSVYLHDSVVTSNYYTDALSRFLVGKYDDELFGSVSTSCYAQFSRLGTLPDSLTFGIYDSISIQLAFDLNYLYGSNTVTPQEIAVFELDETLDRYDSLTPYFSHSTAAVKPTPVGGKVYQVDPELFKEIVDDDVDTTLSIRFKLDDELGTRVFQEVVQYRDSSASFFYEYFRNKVKGLSIAPVQGDKIIAFNPANTQSKIILHFHINKRDSIVLGFNSLTSFNHIESDRSATELSALAERYDDVDLSQGYVQNGVSVLTRLDFSRFFEMADTIPAMIINSAELVIGNVVEPPTNQLPPTNMILRILNSENRFKVDSTEQDALDIARYNFTVGSRSSGTGSYIILDDSRRAALTLPYSSSDKKYNGFLTLFLQELYKNYKNNGPLFSTVALFPSSPTIGKTVNRVAFNKDAIKLRIYYTLPTTTSNQ
jgi:hypothetical protein